jgi:hypothetical protein
MSLNLCHLASFDFKRAVWGNGSVGFCGSGPGDLNLKA